jgi:hypothetical protein
MIANTVGIALEMIKRILVALLKFPVQNEKFGFSVSTFLETH